MTTQNLQLMDAIPVTAALQRLFRANVMSDDQLYDYSLAQALRSVFWAVKKGNSANGQHNCTVNSHINGEVQSQDSSLLCNAEDCNNAFYVIKELCRSATVSLPHVHTCVYLSLRLLCDEASAYGQGNERPCVTEEWIDALTSFVHSTSSAWHVDRRANLGFLIVISAMLHGVVWCGAYNGSNNINKMNESSNNNSERQLETLTMMHNYNENNNTTITASVKHKALFVHFTKLVHDWIRVVLPALTILASNAAALSDDFVDNVKYENNNNNNHNNTNYNQYQKNTIATTTTTTRRSDDKCNIIFKEIESTFRPPSRLVVEVNNCIIHCFHALCTDVLHVHASETNTNTSQSAQNVYKVLDREAPLELWSSLTHVRNALRRDLGWMVEEIKHHCLEYYKNYYLDEYECSLSNQTEVEQHVRCMKEKVEEEYEEQRLQQKKEELLKKECDRVLRMVNQTVSPFTEINTILEHIVSSMLHEQERFSAMRTEVGRKYGDGAKDYHALTDIMFAHTLHMCVCMREVTWSWMRVSGTLLLQNITYFTKFFALPRVGAVGEHYANKDESVLMNLAQCLMQLPEAGCYSSSSSSLFPSDNKEETNVSIATTILLSACLTFFVTAPLRSTQARIWQSNVDVTRQIHGILVQRGLRFRSNHVLKLTSLLSDSIMSSSLSSLDESCELGHGEPECYEHASSIFASQLISTSSEQLLDMIASDRDGASETAKKLLCHAILCQPHVIIPSLFRLLSHGSTTARLNVLDILHTLPQLTTHAPFTLTTNEYTNVINKNNNNTNGNIVASDNNVNKLTVKQSANKCSAKEKRSREMLRLLAQHLLLHIHDEELCVRMQTSQLFSRVASEDVLEPLLRLYMQTDSTGRKQSVSLASLRSVMAAHNTNAEIIFLLLETTYELAEPANLTNIEESKHVDQSKKELTGHDDHSSECVALQASANEQTMKRGNIPHTPGDVLPLSLLYAHEENVDSSDITYLEEEEQQLEQPKDGNNKEIRKGNNANSFTNMSSHSAKSRHDKLNYLINVLLEHWIENVKQITPNVFVSPLLQFLQEKGKSTNEREVQWHVKYITHLLSIISLYATNNKGQWNEEEACSAIMSDTYHVFFDADESKHIAASFSSRAPAIYSSDLKANSLSLNKTIDNAWCITLAELCSQEITSNYNNNNNNLLVYKLLLPLLCLRAYHRELYKVLWRQTTRESNLPIQCICTVLWSGLAISCSCAFSTKYAEIQRILLEVLTRFPSCVFFDELAQTENKLKLTTPSVFWERVFTFGLCAYLNLIITQASSKTSFSCCCSADKVSVANTTPVQEQEKYEEQCKDDFTAVMQQLPILLELTNRRILPWLASDETTTTTTTTQTVQVTIHIEANNKQSNSSTNSTANNEECNIDTVEMQKLTRACIDAFALIVYVNLLNTTQPTPFFYTNIKKEENTTKSYDIDTFSVKPFTTLANIFRSNIVEKDINTTSLSEFQFCVHVQKRVLAILRTQLTSSDAVLQKWWQVYLPLFTELANAACSWLSKRKVNKMEQTAEQNCKHAEEFAVINASTLHIAESCCEILFYAVMASAHTQTSTTISHPCSSQVAIQHSTNYNTQDVNVELANRQSIFAKMACDDQQALMHFALGTAKYYKLPSVQSIGVKLLSALLAAAPELFINLSTTKSKKNEEKLNAGDALDQFKLWRDALSALASVAHIHPDSATRVLAERVLSAFAYNE